MKPLPLGQVNRAGLLVRASSSCLPCKTALALPPKQRSSATTPALPRRGDSFPGLPHQQLPRCFHGRVPTLTMPTEFLAAPCRVQPVKSAGLRCHASVLAPPLARPSDAPRPVLPFLSVSPAESFRTRTGSQCGDE